MGHVRRGRRAVGRAFGRCACVGPARHQHAHPDRAHPDHTRSDPIHHQIHPGPIHTDQINSDQIHSDQIDTAGDDADRRPPDGAGADQPDPRQQDRVTTSAADDGLPADRSADAEDS